MEGDKRVMIVVRCSARERELWRRYAASRGKSLSALVRDGLTSGAGRQCLCSPGLPRCAFCAGSSPGPVG